MGSGLGSMSELTNRMGEGEGCRGGHIGGGGGGGGGGESRWGRAVSG